MTRATSRPGGHADDQDGEESARRPAAVPLGAALRRAWIGYQSLLDEAIEAAGFKRRDFPDGRVLHLCARSSDTTISEIGRELGITRQGASKIVGVLREQGYVNLLASPADGREKLVTLTNTAHAYLKAQRTAARAIEGRLVEEVGSEAFEALSELLELLGANDIPRLRTFLGTHDGGLHVD